MKKLLLSYVIFCFISLNGLYAQCIPNVLITQSGLYPDSLPHAIIGQTYSTVLQLKVPTDTTITSILVPIDSMVLNNIIGLPAGFNYYSSPASNSFAGGANACILFTGAAPASVMVSSYPLKICTTLYFSYLSIPQTLIDTISSYYIKIDSSNSIPTCSAYFSIAADTSQLHHYVVTNNATGVNPINYFWSWGDGAHDTIPYPTHTYADSGFYDICLSITDSSGCTSSFCDSSFRIMRTTNSMVYIDVVSPTITDVNEINRKSFMFNLYPNPTGSILTLHETSMYSQAITISILNILGEIVYTQKVMCNNETRLNIGGLHEGIYFVKVENEHEKWIGRFVKE